MLDNAPSLRSTNEASPLINNSAHMVEHGRESEEELDGCGATLPCDPRRRLHCYVVLILICLLSFGSYFCTDNPAALRDQIIRDLNITHTQFKVLYQLDDWPNVVLCFLGGFAIDRRYSIRKASIMLAVFVFAGQCVMAFGAFRNNYSWMCIGRFLFGFGAESLRVCLNMYCVKWFKLKELHMAFGLQITFSRIANTLNYNTMVPLYDSFQQTLDSKGYVVLGASLLTASVFCLTSLICSIALAYFDKRNDRILHKHETEEVITLKDIKHYPRSIWLMVAILTFTYAGVVPFTELAGEFFEAKWDFLPSRASSVNIVYIVMSAVCSPIGGYLIDKFGRNLYFVLVGTVFAIASHVFFAFTFVTPFFAMVILGLAFSLVASALWPMAAYIVSEHKIGTVYGLIQSLQNLGLASMTLASEAIVDSSGFLLAEILFMFWLLLALLASIWLYRYDATKHGKLNLPATTRNSLLVAEDEGVEILEGNSETNQGGTSQSGDAITPDQSDGDQTMPKHRVSGLVSQISDRIQKRLTNRKTRLYSNLV